MSPTTKLATMVEALKLHYGRSLDQNAREEPFRALIECILSQRTKDVNASRATEALFSVATTPEGILALGEDRLRGLIKPSGFYKMKARYIMDACSGIVDRFDGEVPRKREDLMSLPGVGPKTADIVLSLGYGEPAVAVDTHILRVTRRFGLVREDATPEEVKTAIEGAIPSRDYRFADAALLRLGKEYCKPKRLDCVGCPANGSCKKRF